MQYFYVNYTFLKLTLHIPNFSLKIIYFAQMRQQIFSNIDMFGEKSCERKPTMKHPHAVFLSMRLCSDYLLLKIYELKRMSIYSTKTEKYNNCFACRRSL